VSHLLLLQLLVESVGLSRASSALPRVKVKSTTGPGWLRIATPGLDLRWLGVHVMIHGFSPATLRAEGVVRITW
jgi:hypothetical protein